MGRIGEGGGEVVPRQVFSFAGGLQFFSGAFSRNFKHIVGILSSSPVDWHPFGANWVGGGGSVDMSKSQRHTRTGAGRGVSQANEWSSNSPQTHRIVPA